MSEVFGPPEYEHEDDLVGSRRRCQVCHEFILEPRYPKIYNPHLRVPYSHFRPYSCMHEACYQDVLLWMRDQAQCYTMQFIIAS
jgi:hypothetical protein